MSMKTLQHPSHGHPLNLREWSEDYAKLDLCKACSERVCGSTYCCEKCKFFLHKSCAEVPAQVQHPFHPNHPLVLVFASWGTRDAFRCHACGGRSSSSYQCSLCDFNLDVTCAMSTLSGEESDSVAGVESDSAAGEERRTLQQNLMHEHPLIRCYLNRNNDNIKCGACDRGMAAGAVSYGCCDCGFFLHDMCFKLPCELQHCPLHVDCKYPLTVVSYGSKTFECRICMGNFQLTYRCQECQFEVDAVCALSIARCQDEKGEKCNPDVHEHPLALFSVKPDCWVHCEVCGKRKSGDVYGCLGCKFFLHKDCLKLLNGIQHVLHPDHPLCPSHVRVPTRCNGCRDEVEGFAFSCGDCEFNLHTGCALEPPVLEEGESLEIKHAAHEHSLSLGYGGSGSCNACGGSYGRGRNLNLRYHCLIIDCHFSLHKWCAQVSLLQDIQHPFHPHPLSFLETAELFRCKACQIGHKKFAFHCSNCNFYLDTACASQKPTLKHELHEHNLCYFQKADWLLCSMCGEPCNVDLYLCVPCDFSVHRGCTRLPATVTHRYHRNPLTLIDYIVEDHECGEYLCDFCGKDRNIERGAYICDLQECKLIVHIECAISVVEPKVPKVPEDPVIAELKEKIQNLNSKAQALKMELEAVLQQVEIAKNELANRELANELKMLSVAADSEGELAFRSLRKDGRSLREEGFVEKLTEEYFFRKRLLLRRRIQKSFME